MSIPARYGRGRVGRLDERGLASESAVAAAADGSGDPSSSTGTMSPAGTSDADVSVNSTSANGPDPTGCRPNSLSPSSSIGMSAMRCAGASGWVSACKNPPSGVRSENTTRRGPDDVTATSLHDVDDG